MYQCSCWTCGDLKVWCRVGAIDFQIASTDRVHLLTCTVCWSDWLRQVMMDRLLSQSPATSLFSFINVFSLVTCWLGLGGQEFHWQFPRCVCVTDPLVQLKCWNIITQIYNIGMYLMKHPVGAYFFNPWVNQMLLQYVLMLVHSQKVEDGVVMRNRYWKCVAYSMCYDMVFCALMSFP